MSHFGLGLISSNGVPGNDAFTKALLHFDGTNGSTTFTDVNGSGLSNSWSAVSDGVISTSSPKFGTGSLLSGAGGFGISTPAKSAFDPGTGDFTIDLWYDHNGQSTPISEKGIAAYGNSSVNPTQWAWSIDVTNLFKVQYQLSNGTGQVFPSGSSTVLGSGKHHIAMVRSSGTVIGYVDGVQDVTFSFPGSLPASLGFLKIGRGITVGNPSILVDEFRYSVGIARWTSNFTPPAAQYT